MLLIDALLKGDVGFIESHVSENPKSINEKDENGRSAIHWAAVGGHLNLVDFLSKNITDFDSPDDSGWTPLIIASSAGHMELVKMFLSKGANVNTQTDGGHSALQYAASRNRPEVLECLLEHKADPNIKDERGATALHRASSKGNLKCVEILLQSTDKTNVNAQDCDGNTPLHLACEEDQREVARLLVKHGSDFSITNRKGSTAIELAPKGLGSMLTSIKIQP